MTKSRGIRKHWTPEEDQILLEHMPAIGSYQLEKSGLLPGRKARAMRNRINDIRRKQQGLAPVKRYVACNGIIQSSNVFSRQHASVFGYAAAVGRSA